MKRIIVLVALAALTTPITSSAATSVARCRDTITIIGDRDLELIACIDDHDALREIAIAAMESGVDDIGVCSSKTAVCEPIAVHPACCDYSDGGCGPNAGCDIACCILSIINESCGGCLE